MLGLGAVLASGRIRQGVGLPMLAVLATVAFWYVGDALYIQPPGGDIGCHQHLVVARPKTL